jgi:hypothetical protein
MVRIDVDYNERDSDGYVVARVPAGELANLRTEQQVSLYDPVDHLWADASVAWIDPKTGAVGFNVDWTNFVDGDLAESHQPVTTGLIIYSRVRTRFRVELTSEPYALLVLRDSSFPTSSSRPGSWFSRLFAIRRESRHHIAPKHQVFNYSVRLVPAEQERPSSSSDVELRTGWELARR